MNKYVEAATAARAAALQCIKEARIDNDCYYRHRDVELIPCREDEERCFTCDPEYLLLKEVSGKAIEAAMEGFKNNADFHHISICGGVDCFESISIFFESNGDDYEPGTDQWGIPDLKP